MLSCIFKRLNFSYRFRHMLLLSFKCVHENCLPFHRSKVCVYGRQCRLRMGGLV